MAFIYLNVASKTWKLYQKKLTQSKKFTFFKQASVCIKLQYIDAVFPTPDIPLHFRRFPIVFIFVLCCVTKQKKISIIRYNSLFRVPRGIQQNATKRNYFSNEFRAVDISPEQVMNVVFSRSRRFTNGHNSRCKVYLTFILLEVMFSVDA